MRPRIAAAALIAAALISSSTVAANASPAGPVACASVTTSVAGLTAAQVIRAVTTAMPHACGFTVSGNFDGLGFDIDGWELDGTSTYGALGAAHIVWFDQGMVLDFYRAGGGEYLRIYEDGKPNAAPDLNVRAEWQAFGIASSVFKKAGSAKWIKLTAAQQKKINPEFDLPLTASALASAIAKGSGKPWKLGGTKTVNGVHCTVLTDPANNANGGYLGESLYVATATGLPVAIHYLSQDSQAVATSFGHWGKAGAVNPPPAAKVVQP